MTLRRATSLECALALPLIAPTSRPPAFWMNARESSAPQWGQRISVSRARVARFLSSGPQVFSLGFKPADQVGDELLLGFQRI
jgi:hypothetical protein